MHNDEYNRDSESLLGEGTWSTAEVEGVYLSSSVLDAIDATTSDSFSPLIDSADDYENRKDRISRHSFSSAYTGQVANNSAALTTFLLLNTMIGSGILNQPYVFSKSGVIGGSIAFIIASLATWVGLMILTEVGIYANVLEYSGLAKKAYAKNGERLIDISIIITGLGSILGYILVVGTTTSGLLVNWGCTAAACNTFYTTIIAVALFVTPICLYRHFGHLAILSLFSILAIVAVLLLVVIGGPMQTPRTDIPVLLFDLNGTLASTGSIVFSLSCASANFQAFISTEKSSRNFGSWMRITSTAVFVGGLMCAGMGIAGYLSFRSNTQGEILDNFVGHSFDFFKVMVVCHLVLYIPVAFVITRYSVVKLFFGVRSETLPLITHTILSIGLIAGTTAVVLMLLSFGLASGQAFALILNITGGLGGSLATFMLPAAIYLKLMPVKGSKLRYPAMALFLLGFAVLVAVLTVEIRSFLPKQT